MAEQVGTFADGLVGMVNVFVDPQTTAQRVPSKFSWVWPVVILVAGYVVISTLMLPYQAQLVDATLAQRNIPAEQQESARSMARLFGQVFAYAMPFLVVGFTALLAWLVKLTYSLMDIRPRFRDLFTMLAACSLIPLLQYVATYVVIRMKGDPIDNAEQMQPPFGLDIFLQGLHGPAFALVHFFSIFQIWYLIVLVFGLAYLTKSSKSQALFAITPVWSIPLVLTIIGAMFQK